MISLQISPFVAILSHIIQHGTKETIWLIAALHDLLQLKKSFQKKITSTMVQKSFPRDGKPIACCYQMQHTFQWKITIVINHR